MSMAIVGNRGIGKTSFLAKCEAVAKSRGCITIRFSSIEGDFKSTEDICNHILVQIQNEIIERSKLAFLKKNVIDFFNSFDFKISYRDFGIEIKGKARQPALQSLFRQKLMDIWRNIGGSCNGIIIMIDEAEIIEAITGSLMFLREVFSRLGEEKCGYMLVVSGKLAFPDKMTEKFSPLARFFHPLSLRNFSKEENVQLLTAKLKQTNVKADEVVLYKIHAESEGHPYVSVAIAYVLYENLPEQSQTISMRYFEAVKPKIISYLNADYFGVMYRKASPTGKKVLKQIAELGGEASFTRLTNSLKKNKGAISPIIPELIEQGSLIKVDRGKYKLFHSLYKQCLLSVE